MTHKIINREGLLPTEFTIKNDGGLEIRTFQDVEPILNANKAKQNDSDFKNGYTDSGDMKHVASIPLILLTQWGKEHGVSPMGPEMTEIIRKKLNDPNYAYLRTGRGQI